MKVNSNFFTFFINISLTLENPIKNYIKKFLIIFHKVQIKLYNQSNFKIRHTIRLISDYQYQANNYSMFVY